MGKHRNLSNEQFRSGSVTTSGRVRMPPPTGGGGGGMLVGGALLLASSALGSYALIQSENEKASKPPVSSASYWDWRDHNNGPVPGK